MAETRSTCPYCGVGCGVIIESDGAQITGVRGDPQHPANAGRLCSKGQTLHLTASPAVLRQARLLQPLRRLERDGQAQPASWQQASTDIAKRLADIVQRDGADAVGLYLSGQLLTEDYYVFNKLAKGLLGTNNVDTNSRLCMSSAVAGYKATLGSDAPPACYDDLALADTVLISGANPAWAHPILFRRLEDARRLRPQKWIVIDPRRTDTAAAADLHLQILPGSDIALCHGLLHLMLREGWTDAGFIARHTSGFAALAQRVQGFTPAETARLTGVAEDDLLTAARWFATATASLSLYCQGLNQSASGTAKNAALINLHLACGQIGKPGAGPFSLTGQPNAMGGREVGGLANLLSAHRDLGNAQHRAEVAALWGVDSVPATPGKSAVEMFEAAADGQIKALWIACTNPAQSMPDQATVRRALERAELVVVQEAFATTATARYADWLLPATTWGEKDGTVTNSERRISRVRPAVAAPGQARHDWAIALDIARLLEARLRPGRPTLFPYADAESIWCEHRESTRGRDLDITGLSYALLEQQGPQCWPCPEGQTQGRLRLYTDHRFATADGRARFVDADAAPLAEMPDAQYPISLTTGRLRDQWHGMSRTGTLGRLFGHAPEPVVDLHPQDLQRLGLSHGDLVALRSRRGQLLLPAQASPAVATGQAHVAMHWGDEVLGGHDEGGRPRTGINALTTRRFCPSSKQPELKHSAVQVQAVDLPWRLLAAGWFDADAALALRRTLVDWLPRFAFASVVPFGHAGHGVQLRAAAAAPPPAELLAELEALFGLGAHRSDLLRYEDRGRGQRRTVALQPAQTSDASVPGSGATAGTMVDNTADDTAKNSANNSANITAAGIGWDDGELQLQAFVIAGDTRAEGWIKTLLQERLPAQSYGRQLLSASAEAPVALVPRGRQVCTCFDVSEPQIVQWLGRCAGAPQARLAQLQQQLRCGTHCGSCVPELRRLIAATPAVSTPTAAVTVAES